MINEITETAAWERAVPEEPPWRRETPCTKATGRMSA